MQLSGSQRRRDGVVILFSYVCQRKPRRELNPNALIRWPTGWNNLFINVLIQCGGGQDEEEA